jgi:hypothetical protein
MTHGQLKGALLEYLVRQLLANCGFTSVRPDGHYIFEQRGTGLFYINGKGAAHDADVLMEPPIQMPFSYPSRLLFECKAYETKVGLTVIRNALGLRYDINEFEIVTDETIEQRQNNHRANYAISNRKRYNYQVGVASVNQFSKPAFEIAANNKIPLISLSWFLELRVCSLFTDINEQYLLSLPEELRNNLYSYLKNKENYPGYDLRYPETINFIETDGVIGEIIRQFHTVLGKSYVGLIETGDLIFLFANQTDSFELLHRQFQYHALKARLYYYPDDPDLWILELVNPWYRKQGLINPPYREQEYRNPEFRFYVPDRIMRQWKEFSLDVSTPPTPYFLAEPASLPLAQKAGHDK